MASRSAIVQCTRWANGQMRLPKNVSFPAKAAAFVAAVAGPLHSAVDRWANVSAALRPFRPRDTAMWNEPVSNPLTIRLIVISIFLNYRASFIKTAADAFVCVCVSHTTVPQATPSPARRASSTELYTDHCANVQQR